MVDLISMTLCYALSVKQPDYGTNTKLFDNKPPIEKILQQNEIASIDSLLNQSPQNEIKLYSPKDPEFQKYLKQFHIPSEMDFIIYTVASTKIRFPEFKINGSQLYRFYKDRNNKKQKFGVVTLTPCELGKNGEIRLLRKKPSVYFDINEDRMLVFYIDPNRSKKDDVNISLIVFDPTGSTGYYGRKLRSIYYNAIKNLEPIPRKELKEREKEPRPRILMLKQTFAKQFTHRVQYRT